jgi:hypothetical protein
LGRWQITQWHSDKTAKTGFVGFGSTYLGDYQDFLAEFFSVLPDEAAFIEGVFFTDGALIAAVGLKGGRYAINFSGMGVEQVGLTTDVHCLPAGTGGI